MAVEHRVLDVELPVDDEAAADAEVDSWLTHLGIEGWELAADLPVQHKEGADGNYLVSRLRLYFRHVEPETLLKPWVKWAYQPGQPQDVPAAFMRAYATAVRQRGEHRPVTLPGADQREERLDGQHGVGEQAVADRGAGGFLGIVGDAPQRAPTAAYMSPASRCPAGRWRLAALGR